MKFGKRNPDDVVSLLCEGVEIVGEISFSQGLRVDGLVKGKIHSEGLLVIGSKGRVEAEIVARRVSINGEFRGIIHASDRVEIQKEGKVLGDLYTPCLIIEGGAIFEGKCNMGDRKSEPGTVLKVVEGNGENAKAAQQAAGTEKSWLK